ncbi:MAG: hypothetical protein HND48_06805 [Chloroflexi bacterium]|nr:hypothetical protein [Chloroflexota bacterium]
MCIHPGSGTWTKQWTDERWARVGDLLCEQLDATIVLTGREHELTMTRHIAELMTAHAVVAAGDTSLGALAALFARVGRAGARQWADSPRVRGQHADRGAVWPGPRV